MSLIYLQETVVNTSFKVIRLLDILQRTWYIVLVYIYNTRIYKVEIMAVRL